MDGSPFVFLLNRATAVATAVTVFMAIVFWRRAVKSNRFAPAVDHEETNHPYSGADATSAIFLSHSGRQKNFVEHLNNCLRSANHTPFFDKHTLPKGLPFPARIKHAARRCKLGVVVLSHDFLTSKWPMRELEILVRQRGNGSIVLPLFYALSPEDLKRPRNLCKWRRVWKKNANECENQFHEWEEAVKALDHFNGVIFNPKESEISYIKRVVHEICKLVQSPLLYDLSQIQGHERFAKEVASQFEEAARQCDKAEVCSMVGLHGRPRHNIVPRKKEVASEFEEAARQSDKVCSVVGLYGVGGLGKTTICKVMSNFYASQYPGKCHLIEFPSDTDDKKIVQECKKALQKLADLSDEHLLKNVDSFDQVVQLMREKLGGYDLFLAIDNVWEGSVEAAKRMLGVRFSSNSKILLTSRSEEVLKDLVRGHSNTCLRPLPSPDQEEAFQIFQHTFQLGDLNSLLINTNLLQDVLKTCFLGGNYHPLALKAVSQHVKRVCAGPEGLDNLECCLSDIPQTVFNDPTIFENVKNLVKLNYVNLSAVKKHMFLDIVVVTMAAASSHHFEVTYEMALQWLSILYKKASYSKKALYSKITIAKLISELALDGLIQLENKDDEQIIRVHDLYSDLAQREAAESSRFFTDRSTRSLKEIEWERLERVILRDLRHQYSACFIKELQQQEYQNLQVLSAENIDLSSDIHLDLMPSLCVLKLENGTLGSIENWHDAKGLAIVSLVNLHCAPPLKPIPSIPCLESLVIENVKTVQSPPINLDGCQHLKKLVLVEASVVKEGEESWEASYFSSLTNLESLEIQHFNSHVPRVLNLNALVNLQLLNIQSCKSIKRIEGLDALKNLQELHVQQCLYLSNLDGLSKLLKLAFVKVYDCEALNRMPDLSGLAV